MLLFWIYLRTEKFNFNIFFLGGGYCIAGARPHQSIGNSNTGCKTAANIKILSVNSKRQATD